MKRRALVRNTVLLTLGLLVVALVAWPVYAHCGDCAASGKEMVTAMDAGKSTLSAAIAAAETATKGKAVSANCIMDGKNLGYDVHCMVGDKIMEVELDGAAKVKGTPKDAKTLHHHGDAKHDEKEHKDKK